MDNSYTPVPETVEELQAETTTTGQTDKT